MFSAKKKMFGTLVIYRQFMTIFLFVIKFADPALAFQFVSKPVGTVAAKG